MKEYTKEQCKSKIAKWTKRLEGCKEELVVGKWYTDSRLKFSKVLILHSGKNFSYGFNMDGDYGEYYLDSGDKTYLIPATNKEVKEALIKEAKKRGYKNGNYKCLEDPNLTRDIENAIYVVKDGCLLVKDGIYINTIFDDGKWAEIIEEPVYEYRWINNDKVEEGYYAIATTCKDIKDSLYITIDHKPITETKRIRQCSK